jgi:NAD(P)-dependent dehydrogenase (short-subunit alcohol dehydrogenase family)
MLDEILSTEEGVAAVSAITTVGRVGKPEDMGAACVFLSSRGGSYITGAVLPVDGGLLVGRGANQ